MNEITGQFLYYFSTVFVSSLILQIISKKVVPKTPNINLLEKQLEAYKNLYYNTVCDNLYNNIDNDKASKYIKDFYIKVNEDLDYSMLFSTVVLKKIRNYNDNPKWKFKKRESLYYSITKDFNKIRRSLGYLSNSTFLEKFFLYLAVAFLTFVFSSLLSFLYLQITNLLPSALKGYYYSIILAHIGLIALSGNYIYMNKEHF